MLFLISGKTWPNWYEVLDPESSLWREITEVRKVLVLDEPLSKVNIAIQDYRKVISLELSNASKPQYARAFNSLSPSEASVNLLAEKDVFYNFLRASHLGSYMPRSVDLTSANLHFPFIIKRVDLAGGIGVELISDRKVLDEQLKTSIFKGKRLIIQEYIEADTDFVTHVLCKNGEIIWNASFEGPVHKDSPINRGPFAKSVANIEPNCLNVFNKIMQLARYEGVAAINFRIRDGKPIIFEINPRLGGSLFLPLFRGHLIELLKNYVHHSY